jgi:ABC-2 type transport system permease protein
MKKVLYLAAGKLLRMFREPWAFLAMLLLPLAFTYFMGSMHAGSNGRIPVIVVDNDGSNYSRSLIEVINNEPAYGITVADKQSAVEGVKNYNALAAFIIPGGFAEQVQAGLSPRVEVYQAAGSAEVYTARHTFQSALDKTVSESSIADFVLKEISPSGYATGREQQIRDRVIRDVRARWLAGPPVAVESSSLNGGSTAGYRQVAHASVGFALFFAMYTMVFGVGEILTEKKNGTWRRLLSLPLARWQILSGNLLGTFAAGFSQLLVLMLAGRYLFGVDWGRNILPSLVIVAAFVFCVTCLGLLLSGVVKNYKQLAALTPVLLVSTSMLGGCFWPLDIVQSKLLLTAAKFVPQTWALSSLEGIILNGQTLGGVFLPAGVMLLMGLLFFIAGLFTLRWEI